MNGNKRIMYAYVLCSDFQNHYMFGQQNFYNFMIKNPEPYFIHHVLHQVCQAYVSISYGPYEASTSYEQCSMENHQSFSKPNYYALISQLYLAKMCEMRKKRSYGYSTSRSVF